MGAPQERETETESPAPIRGGLISCGGAAGVVITRVSDVTDDTWLKQDTASSNVLYGAASMVCRKAEPEYTVVRLRSTRSQCEMIPFGRSGNVQMTVSRPPVMSACGIANTSGTDGTVVTKAAGDDVKPALLCASTNTVYCVKGTVPFTRTTVRLPEKTRVNVAVSAAGSVVATSRAVGDGVVGVLNLCEKDGYIVSASRG
mmetsp:Transcript_3460/g.10709  ORF Transcript_3460/g.10709 Transcript_3460/m.10709 type:complete len:201 (+) Transcript_3460:1361-1963(+)